MELFFYNISLQEQQRNLNKCGEKNSKFKIQISNFITSNIVVAAWLRATYLTIIRIFKNIKLDRWC